MSDRSAYFRARRRRLRDERKCIQCRAGLQKGDGVRCIECTEEHRIAERDRWHEPAFKRKQQARRVRLTEVRKQQRLCSCCGKARPVGDNAWCDGCLQRNKLYSILGTGQTRKPAIRARENWREYVPLDEAEQSYRVRLLRALWWMDWSETREIFRASGIEDDYWSRDRNAAQVTLGRLVKYGLVDRRVTDKPQNADYRITEAGRAEVQRYRTGDLKLRFKRAA